MPWELDGSSADALRFFSRTLAIYFLLLVVMRLMGKREIGNLSPIDLVVTIMIADAAIIAVEEQKPLLIGMIPVLTLVLAEIILSYLSLKSIWLRNLINGRPTIIIEQGEINQRQMRLLRYNINDLLSQLREKDIHDISEVEYAILEPTGRLSIVPKAQFRPVTPNDLSLQVPNDGIVIVLISDGKIVSANLKRAGKNEAWLMEELRQRNIRRVQDVFLAIYRTADDTLRVQRRNNS